MTRRIVPVLVVALGTLAGCSPKYRVVSNESESPVLSDQCQLYLYDRAPEGRAYEILGTIEPVDPAVLTTSGVEFLDAVRPGACRRTANAVIATRNEAGQYLSGTLIRVR